MLAVDGGDTVIKEGKVATYDVKGRAPGSNPNSTLEVAEEVARKL